MLNNIDIILNTYSLVIIKLTIKNLFKTSSLDMLCTKSSPLFITIAHFSHGWYSLTTAGCSYKNVWLIQIKKNDKNIIITFSLFSNKILSMCALLHKPETVQTMFGSICEAKVSTSSGIKSSDNFLHSFLITFNGNKSQDPSKTSFNSS